MDAFVPSHRNPDDPQPEVCQVTGHIVASKDLVISNVQGLRGVAVGNQGPFLAAARFRPSWLDMRAVRPSLDLVDAQKTGIHGDPLWFRG